jgi:hypothetical protein
MLRSRKNKVVEKKDDEFIVDRLPSSFINDPQTFRILLGEQIDRFWPAFGLNFLFDDAGNVNGFFEGSFLYMFQLNDNMETYTVATCVKDCSENEERYESIKQILLEKEAEISIQDNFSLEWTEFKELILKQERVPINLVQEDQVDGFESSIDEFISTAQKITGLIKSAEKQKKRENSKGSGSFFRKRTTKTKKDKPAKEANSKAIPDTNKRGSIRSIRQLFGRDFSRTTEFDDSDLGASSLGFNSSYAAKPINS